MSHYVHIVCPKVLERKNQHQLKEELEQILMTQLKLREELKQELEVLEMQHKQKKKQKQLEQELETQLAHEKGPKRLEEELKIHILHSYISLMAASYCCLRMVKMVRVPLCVGVLHVLNYIGNLGAYSPGTLF